MKNGSVTVGLVALLIASGAGALGYAADTNDASAMEMHRGGQGAKPEGMAPPQPRARVPVGIYAVVPVEKVVANQQTENPSITTAELDTYLDGFYTDLLNNPAVSGLALQIHWDTLNPNAPTDPNPYFWNYVDDAFTSVSQWNLNNPTATLNPKTIQLIVTPGFNSPQWVRDALTSCDPLFYGSPVPSGFSCSEVTFTNFQEGGDSTVLPLPWDPTYQAAWKTFLQALAARYDDKTAFVSIAVAGPTAASAEMILPNGTTENQLQFVSDGGTAIAPNTMWKALLQLQYPDNTTYWGTDQAFIDAWNAAIDMYGEVFSGVTLVATTGNGLPKFGATAGPFPAPTTPIDFTPDCLYSENMDCQAETTVLEHFVDPSVGGFNAKATQTSGLEATRPPGDLGEVGVRYLSQLTAGSTETSQILGGAQFNAPLSVDNGAETEGGSPVVAQALFNMLQDFFTGTSVAGAYCEPFAVAPAPLNYLQIYHQDIQYASNHGVATSVNEVCSTVMVSAQDELNTASQQLLEIAEP